MNQTQLQVLICKNKKLFFLLKILFYNKPKSRPEYELG